MSVACETGVGEGKGGDLGEPYKNSEISEKLQHALLITEIFNNGLHRFFLIFNRFLVGVIVP